MSSEDPKIVYLDNNATTKIDPEVVEAMMPYLTTEYGNPSSQHRLALNSDRAIERATEQVADFVGAEYPDEIVFTSCATESDNTALFNGLFTTKDPNKNHIVTSPLEHPAILAPARFYEGRGAKLDLVEVDGKGRLNVDHYESLLGDQTAIASLMWANNETGNIYDVPRLAEIAHSHGVLFHTDAVQAAAKVPLNFKDTAVDMLSIAGHKIHGPKGVGVLAVKRGTRFIPLIMGGHQQALRRAGTDNVAYMVGMGKACELAKKELGEMNTRVRALRDRLEAGLLQRIPECFVTGDPSNRVPNTSNIAFKFVEGEAISILLSNLGICVGTGSACASSSIEPSSVMMAMKIPFEYAHGTIRFSLSRYTTDEDVDRTLEAMPLVIKTLRDLSPFWTEGKPSLKHALEQEACTLVDVRK